MKGSFCWMIELDIVLFTDVDEGKRFLCTFTSCSVNIYGLISKRQGSFICIAPLVHQTTQSASKEQRKEKYNHKKKITKQKK